MQEDNSFKAKPNDIVKLQNIYNGYQLTACLNCVARLDVASKLGNSVDAKRSAKEIAKDVGADPNYLGRVLHTLVANGVFQEVDNSVQIKNSNAGERVFKHNDVSLTLLDPLVRDEMIMTGSIAFSRSQESFTDTVVTGKSQIEKALGEDIWVYYNKNTEEQVEFSKGMTALTTRTSPFVASNFDYSQFETICDVGGSHGVLLNEILKTYPNGIKKAINFDQKYILPSMNGLSLVCNDPRYTEVDGDFFASVPSVDCYILKTILHDWDDEKSREILNVISKSIKPGGKITVVEHLVDDNNKENDLFVSSLDLLMMQLCDARERTKSEFEEMVKGTPFKIEQFIESKVPHIQSTIVLCLK